MWGVGQGRGRYVAATEVHDQEEELGTPHILSWAGGAHPCRPHLKALQASPRRTLHAVTVPSPREGQRDKCLQQGD